jgi:hypothetical protein
VWQSCLGSWPLWEKQLIILPLMVSFRCDNERSA